MFLTPKYLLKIHFTIDLTKNIFLKAVVCVENIHLKFL